MAMQWTPDLSTGVEEIDNQHKELITRINNLLSAMQQAKGTEELTSTVRFLDDYVTKHFAAEGRYMTKYGYPGFTAHKNEHDRFVSEFTALKSAIQAQGPTTVLVLQVQKKVCDWLVQHISRTDKALGAFMLQKKAA